MKKKTTTKKPAARPIPPPPPGWEIVGEDDPRLREPLAVIPMMFTKIYGWTDNLYSSSEGISKAMKRGNVFALPIATQSATPQASPPMTPLRLPSEKPTREDANEDGHIFIICPSISGRIAVIAWTWNEPFDGSELAWFSLPEGILPREPTQEEKWRAEFLRWFKEEDGNVAREGLDWMWHAFLAAKKGGAE
jgi:hypothetical protein